ncbi:hypothetical protein TNCV_998231 [Trichonephila clavipes]|nr:hypothetical protein TNCV_998231 [Trichonephila clavipes]
MECPHFTKEEKLLTKVTLRLYGDGLGPFKPWSNDEERHVTNYGRLFKLPLYTKAKALNHERFNVNHSHLTAGFQRHQDSNSRLNNAHHMFVTMVIWLPRPL